MTLDVPKTYSVMKRAFWTALICGVLPLVVGVAIFVLWLITRWNWLMMAGLFTIYFGMAIVMVGVLALVRFWWLARRKPGLSRRRLWLSTAVCSFLLLSNFPVAAGIIRVGIKIETSYKVVVHNASEETLVNVRVFGGGCDEALGSISPSAVTVRKFWIKHDGVLEFRAESATSTYTTMIDGYVTNNSMQLSALCAASDAVLQSARSRRRPVVDLLRR